MATLSNADRPTLSDWANYLDPKGQVAKIVDFAKQTNEILEDMVWVEGNLPDGHKFTKRTGHSVPSWRRINQGISPSNVGTVPETITCGLIEDRNEVDKRLAMLNGNTKAFRLAKAKHKLRDMGREAARAVFYESQKKNSERITGLTYYYNDPSVESGENLLDAGGSGSDNTSIWLVVWGDEQIFGCFPKASKAGLQHTDLGEDDLLDANGKKFRGYSDLFEWDLGLCVADWRYGCRICNIDMSDLTGTSAADLVSLMALALDTVEDLNGGRAAFYMNRKLRGYLRQQMLGKGNLHLTWDELAGKKVMSFGEVPVRRCDSLLLTEEAISFA